MREKLNSVVVEKDWHEMLGGWDGTPQVDPTYRIEVYWIDPYWYVATSDGTHRVVSQDKVITDDDLIWSVGEHIRLLRLPQYRKPDET